MHAISFLRASAFGNTTPSGSWSNHGQATNPYQESQSFGRYIERSRALQRSQEPANPNPIGAPYRGMTPAQMKVWKECAENMLWLNASHRLLLRQVSILAARMETDPEVGVSAMHALSAMLSKLGATPTDESKVNHPDGDEDQDDKFFH